MERERETVWRKRDRPVVKCSAKEYETVKVAVANNNKNNKTMFESVSVGGEVKWVSHMCDISETALAIRNTKSERRKPKKKQTKNSICSGGNSIGKCALRLVCSHHFSLSRFFSSSLSLHPSNFPLPRLLRLEQINNSNLIKALRASCKTNDATNKMHVIM